MMVIKIPKTKRIVSLCFQDDEIDHIMLIVELELHAVFSQSCVSGHFVVILFSQSTKPGRKGAIHCPRIDTVLTEDIYLPVGVPKMVLLKGYNFPQLRVRVFSLFITGLPPTTKQTFWSSFLYFIVLVFILLHFICSKEVCFVCVKLSSFYRIME